MFWDVTPCLQGSGNLIPLLHPENYSDTGNDYHLTLFLFNAFVNDVEETVQNLLIKFTGTINWEVSVTRRKRRNKCRRP